MADNRKKASMSQVLADIKPYFLFAVPAFPETDPWSVRKRKRRIF